MAITESSNTISKSRGTGASSRFEVCKGWKAPFKRCYCGEEAPCSVSWSDNNPGRRYYGCCYWPDENEDCGYFEWYDDEVSDWFKQLLIELKPKRKGKGKRSTETLAKPSLGHHGIAPVDRLIVGMLLLLVLMVGIVIGMLFKK